MKIKALAVYSLELLSRLELPNLFLTKEVLYLLSYNSIFRTSSSVHQ